MTEKFSPWFSGHGTSVFKVNFLYLADELAELRKEILDLKAAQEDSKGLAKMIQKEKSKNKVLRKKLKSLDAKVSQMETKVSAYCA